MVKLICIKIPFILFIQLVCFAIAYTGKPGGIASPGRLKI
jgi:hypothetical protein